MAAYWLAAMGRRVCTASEAQAREATGIGSSAGRYMLSPDRATLH